MTAANFKSYMEPGEWQDPNLHWWQQGWPKGVAAA